MKITYRKAEARDKSAILNLVRSYPDKLMQSELPKLTEFFVACEGKAIVGCAALVVYSKRLAEIRTLAVSKTHQGKGIASKLIKECVKQAKVSGVYEVITITGAKTLFEKNDFSIFNEEKFTLFKVLGKSPARRVLKSWGL